MVPLRGFVGLCLVLLLALSGCTSPPAPAPVENDDVGVVTRPDDFTYLLNGTAPGSHIHDYWNGQNIRTIIEATDDCLNCEATYGGSANGALVGSFRAPPDTVVPQGTARLFVNATWSIEDGEYGDIALFVKTANMTDAAMVAVFPENGSLIYTSTNHDNDPPHHRLSLWEFEIRAMPPSGADQTRIKNWEVSLLVQAQRGLPIPVYPPHPDLWNGASEIVLHESEREVAYHFENPGIEMCNGCLGWHRPAEGKIVPYDATAVTVTLEVTEGLPATLDLLYHGADSWDYAAAPLATDEPTRKVWAIPVEGKPDSPYAKQSLWEFRVVNDQPTEVKLWSGTYTLLVKVGK